MPQQHTATSDHKRPGRRRSSHSHHAVLDATLTLLGQTGYSALTMEAVATHAGVGRATIYRWWPSKASLVIEALDTTIPTPRPTPTGDTRTDIRTIVQATVDHYIHTPLGPHLATLAADAANDATAMAQLASLLGPRRAADASVLLAAASRGDLPHDLDVHLLLDLIMGTLIFRALLGVPPDDRIVDQLTDLIVDGSPPRTASRTDL